MPAKPCPDDPRKAGIPIFIQPREPFQPSRLPTLPAQGRKEPPKDTNSGGASREQVRSATPHLLLLWQMVNHLPLHDPGRCSPSRRSPWAIGLLIEEQSSNVQDWARSQIL